MTGMWRVGNHQPRNLYIGDRMVGVMVGTEEEAAKLSAAIVAAMNGATANDTLIKLSPIETVIEDRQGDRWIRGPEGWGIVNGTGLGGTMSLRDVHRNYGPLRIVSPKMRPVEPNETGGAKSVIMDQPIGTKVRDHEGDIWIRSESGWGSVTVNGDVSFDYIFAEYGPLRIVSKGNG